MLAKKEHMHKCLPVIVAMVLVLSVLAVALNGAIAVADERSEIYVILLDDYPYWYIGKWAGTKLIVCLTNFHNFHVNIIHTEEQLRELIENPPYNVTVVNCHGEILPSPYSWAVESSDKALEYVRMIATIVKDYGWTWVEMAGYPFYRVAYHDQMVEIGSTGLDEFLSVVGAKGDCWASIGGCKKSTHCVISDNFKTWAERHGFDLPSKINVGRPLAIYRDGKVGRIIVTYTPIEKRSIAELWVAVGAVELGKGVYVHSGIHDAGVEDPYIIPDDATRARIALATLLYSLEQLGRSCGKIYILYDGSKGASWINPTVAKDTIVSELERLGIPYEVINFETFWDMLTNPLLENVTVINCHGECLPAPQQLMDMPFGGWDKAMWYIELVASAVVERGWVFVHLAGYPFWDAWGVAGLGEVGLQVFLFKAGIGGYCWQADCDFRNLCGKLTREGYILSCFSRSWKSSEIHPLMWCERAISTTLEPIIAFYEVENPFHTPPYSEKRYAAAIFKFGKGYYIHGGMGGSDNVKGHVIALLIAYLHNPKIREIIDSVRAEYELKISELQEKYSELSARYDELSSKHAALQSEISSLEDEIESMEKQMLLLRAKYERSKREAETIIAEYEKLKSTYEKMTSEYSKLKSTLSSLKSELSTAEYKKASCESSIRSLEESKQELEAEIASARGAVMMSAIVTLVIGLIVGLLIGLKLKSGKVLGILLLLLLAAQVVCMPVKAAPAVPEYRTVYMLWISDIGGSFLDRDAFFREMMNDLARIGCFDIRIIRDLSTFQNLLENPPKKIIVINCHGENLPTPYAWAVANKSAALQYIAMLRQIVAENEWIWVEPAGGAFWRVCHTSGCIDVGSDGVSTFLNAPSDVWATLTDVSPARNAKVTDEFKSFAESIGLNIPERIWCRRPLVSPIEPLEYLYRYDPNYADPRSPGPYDYLPIGIVKMGNGYYVHIGAHYDGGDENNPDFDGCVAFEKDGEAAGRHTLIAAIIKYMMHKGYIPEDTKVYIFADDTKGWSHVDLPTLRDLLVNLFESLGINYEVINADQLEQLVLFSNVTNIVVVNCHGEFVPPGTWLRERVGDALGPGEKARLWFRAIGEAVAKRGWTWIHVGGYPFWDAWGVAGAGDQGLQAFFAAIGKGAVCWDADNSGIRDCVGVVTEEGEYVLKQIWNHITWDAPRMERAQRAISTEATPVFVFMEVTNPYLSYPYSEKRYAGAVFKVGNGYLVYGGFGCGDNFKAHYLISIITYLAVPLYEQTETIFKEKYEKVYKSLEEEYYSLSKKYSELEEEIPQLEKKKEDLSSKYMSLFNQFRMMREELSKFDAKKKEYEEIKAKVDALTPKVEGLKAEVSKVQKALESIQSELRTLEEKKASLESEVAALESEYSSVLAQQNIAWIGGLVAGLIIGLAIGMLIRRKK